MFYELTRYLEHVAVRLKMPHTTIVVSGMLGQGGATHMRDARSLLIVLFLAGTWPGSGCAEDAGGQPDGPLDAGTDPTGPDATGADGHDEEPAVCDMNGTWVVVHHTINTALGAMQVASNYYYYEITQDGDDFTADKSLACGFVSRGTTDVSLPDKTTSELARRTPQGRTGSFKLNEAADGCELIFDRDYVVRGADEDRFLNDLWQRGDPPISLNDLPLPANEAEDMEDWDEDGFEGITLLTGLGDRYVAQIDWNEYLGSVPPNSDQFGGKGVIDVDYDSREMVSSQTTDLLRISATPLPPG